MRNMSFSKTTRQIKDRTKTVTRRIGWSFLKPGDKVCAVEKVRGLKKGERVERLAVIECISNTIEQLDRITAKDVEREGFPGWTPHDFISFFTEEMKCEETAILNRIEFRYVEVKATCG